MVHDARPASKSATLTSALFQSPCNLQTWSMISWRANFVGSVSSKENYIYMYMSIYPHHIILQNINPYKSTILIHFEWQNHSVSMASPGFTWLHPGARARQMGHVPPASWSFLAQPKQVLWWHLGGIQCQPVSLYGICLYVCNAM